MTRLKLTIDMAGMPAGWAEGRIGVGLQSGPSPGTIVTGERVDDGIRFLAEISVVEGKDGLPDFKGTLVHGKPGERFLYLGWGEIQGGRHAMFRRCKLYLGPLTRAGWSQPGIGWDLARTGAASVTIPGCLPDGTPMCATCPALWAARAE